MHKNEENPPFRFTDEAIAFVMELLSECNKDGCQDEPFTQPELMLCYRYQTKDDSGNTLERCDVPTIFVAWEMVHAFAADVNSVVVGNRHIVIPPSTAQYIGGKTVDVQTLEVGFPIPSERKRRLLVVKETKVSGTDLE